MQTNTKRKVPKQEQKLLCNTQAVSGGSLVFSPITSAIRARLHIPCDLIGETTIRLVPTWCGAFYLEDYNDSGVL